MSDENQSYFLGYDYTASTRLGLMHYLKRDIFGFDIHPSIPTPDPAAHIADVACGNALWLVDLSSKLPSTTSLHGFDISTDMLPHNEWLPNNVKLSQWNVFDDPPSDYLGTFDLIHVRALATILRDANIASFIDNMFKLLKPGGDLQIEEANGRDASIVKSTTAGQTPGMDELIAFFKRAGSPEAGFGWQWNYPSLLDQAGFDVTEVIHFGEGSKAASRKLLKYQNDELFVSLEAMFKKWLGADESKTMLDSLERASSEVSGGTAILLPWYVIVARKKLL